MKKSKLPPSVVTEPATVPSVPKIAVASLQDIRNSALRQRHEIGKTIAELDAWRNEIDATIAFLKSQRKK